MVKCEDRVSLVLLVMRQFLKMTGTLGGAASHLRQMKQRLSMISSWPVDSPPPTARR